MQRRSLEINSSFLTILKSSPKFDKVNEAITRLHIVPHFLTIKSNTHTLIIRNRFFLLFIPSHFSDRHDRATTIFYISPQKKRKKESFFFSWSSCSYFSFLIISNWIEILPFCSHNIHLNLALSHAHWWLITLIQHTSVHGTRSDRIQYFITRLSILCTLCSLLNGELPNCYLVACDTSRVNAVRGTWRHFLSQLPKMFHVTQMKFYYITQQL